jgi:hypothetical protein
MKLSTMVLAGVVTAGLAASTLFAAEDNVRPGRAPQGLGNRARYARQYRQHAERPGEQGVRAQHRRRAREGQACGQNDDGPRRRRRLTAALLIRKFDKNDDGKLGERELEHMLRWLRNTRAHRQGDDGADDGAGRATLGRSDRVRQRAHRGAGQGDDDARPAARARNRRRSNQRGLGVD